MRNCSDRWRLRIRWRFGIRQLLLACAWIAIWGLLFLESTFLEDNTQPCNEITFSANGEFVAVGGRRDTRVYCDSTLLATIPQANTRATGTSRLKFTDAETLSVVTHEAVYFYSVTTRDMVRHLPLRSGQERALILRDKILVQEFNTSTFRHRFRFFELDADQGSKPISTHTSPHVSTGMSATNDGRFIAFFWGNLDVELLHQMSNLGIQIYDVESQATFKRLPSANGIQFSPDNSMVLVCGAQISLFDWPNLSEKWSLRTQPCHDIHFSRDGKLFAVMNHASDLLFVFESNSGTELSRIKLDPDRGTGFTFANDGNSVWLPAQDQLGGIQEWSFRSGGFGRRIGNRTTTRWIVFSFVFVVWALLCGLNGDIPKRISESLLGTRLGSFFMVLVGVTGLAIGVLRCFDGLPLYQHTSTSSYLFAFSSNTVLLLIACWVVTMGFRCSVAMLTRESQRKGS